MSNQHSYDDNTIKDLWETLDHLAQLQSPAIQALRRLSDHVVIASHMCAIPNGSQRVQFRRDGQRHSTTKRALVYFMATGKAATFGLCTCRNPNCANPAHQTILRAYSPDQGHHFPTAYTFKEPRA